MHLLCELIEIKKNVEMLDLLEDLGNLRKLGLGTMVDAFKQTYSRGKELDTRAVGNKFSRYDHGAIGRDSETVDGGIIKNWNGLKKVYLANKDDYPLATIFSVDGKPVSLMIASISELDSINSRVALAWDFSSVKPTPEEATELTKGLNSKGSESSWRRKVVGDVKPEKSSRSEKIEDETYNYQTSKYEKLFVTKKYSGFAQTVREVTPFVNNLAKAFGSRLTVKLILADKARMEKRNERNANPPIDPKVLKLFTDEIKTRLAKYKNSKVASAEDAQDFVNKVFGGGLKRLKFAGSTYTVVPAKEYIGSNDHRGQGKGYKSFYNGTMSDLISGKNVTMQFEADRAESDYNTLYLTVKFSKGQLIPVEARYNNRDDKNKGQTVKF